MECMLTSMQNNGVYLLIYDKTSMTVELNHRWSYGMDE